MRRIAISNIAWKPEEDEAVAEVLREQGIDAIETVPGRRPLPGFEVIAMQALFTGTSGLNIFKDHGKLALKYLSGLINIAGHHGIKTLVFGAPKQRDKGKLHYEEAFAAAARFFNQLGEIAEPHGVKVCIEPVRSDNCNFIRTTKQAAELVDAAYHPAIRLQLDTGAMAENNEDPAKVVQDHGEIVGHVHISEPGLEPLGFESRTPHKRMAQAFSDLPPEIPLSIEMLTKESAEAHVELAAIFVREVYRCA